MIKFMRGDATLPDWDEDWGRTLIAHVVNDAGIFNAGFARAIKDRYPAVAGYYLKAINENNIVPGNVIYAPVRDELKVANLVAMHGVVSSSNPHPLDYEALAICLDKLAKHAQKFDATVHMPRIGAGLARGDWDVILPLIEAAFENSSVNVYIYDYP
jgi:O-acetyl-ADP-ribose deacetylase (regulator of RNase III)